MVIDIRKIWFYLIGLVTGVANGLFGSGGGILAVPMLEKAGLKEKNSHCTSIAITLSLSIVSCVIYGYNGNIDYKTALIVIPFGLLGASIGGKLIKKISVLVLKRIFGILLIIAGVRMFF